MTDAQKITICGPNLRDQSKGQLHVHASWCHDLVRRANREPEYRNGWTIEVKSLREIVTAVYDPGDFNYDEASEWRDYSHDIYVFPCVSTLPEEES